MSEGIRSIETKGEDGNYCAVRIVFGPHYFVEIHEDDGRVTFSLGATHHGFQADASVVGGELDLFINELMESHYDHVIDEVP